MIYAARYEAMNGLLAFLTENCCQGAPCAPAVECKPARQARQSPSLEHDPDKACPGLDPGVETGFPQRS